MKMISAAKLKIVQTARTALAIEDSAWRALLKEHGCRTGSSKELSEWHFARLMDHLNAQPGFTNTSKRRPPGGVRPGKASDRQIGLIKALWSKVTDGKGTDKTLGKWLERFGVSSVNFLDYDDAPQHTPPAAIEAPPAL